VAVVTQPSSSTANAVKESRHIALPILALGVVIAILYLGRLFFITSLIALTIAFILEPFVALLMRIRFPRSLASFVVCSFALALLYVIGLGAYRSFPASTRNSQVRAAHRRHYRRHTAEDRREGTPDLKGWVPARQRQEEERRQRRNKHARPGRAAKGGGPHLPHHRPPGPAGVRSRREHPSATTSTPRRLELPGTAVVPSSVPGVLHAELA
jgi:hypothetical protein